MTLAYDIVVAGVITVMMFLFHRVGVELFAPGGKLWEVATTGTQNMNGLQHASNMFQVIVVWMPTLFIAGIWLWVLIRAYKRLVQTAVRRPA